MASKYFRDMNSEDFFPGFVNDSNDERFISAPVSSRVVDEVNVQPIEEPPIPIDYDPVELMEDNETVYAPVDANVPEAEGEEQFAPNRISDVLFSTALADCGSALLKKAATPAMKIKKKKTMQEVIDYILLRKGVKATEQQILKKINNMKSRIKSKTDLKATGNKKIVLNEGEKIFFKLMGAEENPTVVKLSYGTSAGASGGVHTGPSTSAGPPSAPQHPNVEDTEYAPPASSDPEDFEGEVASPSLNATPVLPKRHQKRSKQQHETPTTSTLTLVELQRHVLLKQLEVFEEQRLVYQRMGETLTKVDQYIEMRMNTTD